jgi:hypothetical protein
MYDPNSPDRGLGELKLLSDRLELPEAIVRPTFLAQSRVPGATPRLLTYRAQMGAWSAIVRVGEDHVEVSVDRQGGIEPTFVALMRDEAIRRGVRVELTATGPEVPLSVHDPPSVVAWVLEMFDVVKVLRPAYDWPDDPRTELPDGAVG